MKRLFLLLAICCACTFTRDKKDDEHLAVQEHAAQKLDEHETETKQTGPETITTTTEEYEDADEPVLVRSGDAGGGLPVGPVLQSGHQVDAPRPIGRVLVKRTVTIDQRGPVVATKTREAEETGAEDVGLDMTRHTETTSETSPALAGWLWMALAAAAVVGGGWLAWKFSLPGKLLALIRGA